MQYYFWWMNAKIGITFIFYKLCNRIRTLIHVDVFRSTVKLTVLWTEIFVPTYTMKAQYISILNMTRLLKKISIRG